MTRRLVLVRHGEAAWGAENKFCSWVDKPLTQKGQVTPLHLSSPKFSPKLTFLRHSDPPLLAQSSISLPGENEAKECGELLAAQKLWPDVVFTSVLGRATNTARIILDEMKKVIGKEMPPILSSWRLNERHYGSLIGVNRSELAAEHGEEKVRWWRRAYDARPPPIPRTHLHFSEIYEDQRYADVEPSQLPVAESLRDVVSRLKPYWAETMATTVQNSGITMVVAHGNSIRALLKLIEEIEDDVIVGVSIPTATPLLLSLTSDLKPMNSHHFLGDPKAIEDAIRRMDEQGKAEPSQ
uniref:phosphoglycerate mutase (2,3-diphosphoglycerate-dependent) n=1 Tax=Eptatretus burgeri TaxID=7764 RepID=A0A8C4R5H1_EPTBU